MSNGKNKQNTFLNRNVLSSCFKLFELVQQRILTGKVFQSSVAACTKKTSAANVLNLTVGMIKA